MQISNISNLKELIPVGEFRMAANATVQPYVLGAWIRLCQIAGENRSVDGVFDPEKIGELIAELKSVMVNPDADIQKELRQIMTRCGIDFSIVHNFRGAPVQGYISRKQDGTYQMCLTLRGSYADIFWFSLFHELGHIVNGDISKATKFLDDGSDEKKEEAADLFASNHLLTADEYQIFIAKKDFSIEAIKKFAEAQNVMPYIVIGRLQKERYLSYKYYSDYKLRYFWE